MCNHQYSLPEFENKTCEVSTFFRNGEGRIPLELKYDALGVCVFHSRDLAWKENIFWEYFELLISWFQESGLKRLPAQEFEFFGAKDRWAFLRGETLDFTLDLRGAKFHEGMHLCEVKTDFVNLSSCVAVGLSTFELCEFGDFYGLNSTIGEIAFKRCRFNGSALFNEAAVTGFCEFSNCTFQNYVSFKKSVFTGISEGYKFLFSENVVNSALDFESADFAMDVFIEDSVFNGEVDFIDTCFREGNSVEFWGPKINSNFNFLASDGRPKLFSERVSLLVHEEDLIGSINFKNVNFVNIVYSHRQSLKKLVRTGKVNIGKGCIKYNRQTPLMSVDVSEHNQILITELANTFAQFMRFDDEVNLGFEIEEQTKEKIKFFYFSDMEISDSEFLNRLYQGESQMWSLFKIKDDSVAVDTEVTVEGHVADLNKFDALISLGAFALKLTARIRSNSITNSELSSILNATPHALSPIAKLHSSNRSINQIVLFGFRNSLTVNENNE